MCSKFSERLNVKSSNEYVSLIIKTFARAQMYRTVFLHVAFLCIFSTCIPMQCTFYWAVPEMRLKFERNDLYFRQNLCDNIRISQNMLFSHSFLLPFLNKSCITHNKSCLTTAYVFTPKVFSALTCILENIIPARVIFNIIIFK